MGLCVSPGYIPTVPEYRELKPPYIRSILYSLSDAHILALEGLPLVITLNNECKEVGSDWSGWDLAVLNLCKMFQDSDQLKVIVAGNEFDLYWTDGDQSVAPEFGADLAIRTTRIAKNFGIEVAATSVASPRWVEYLSIMADLCRHDVKLFDIHPYGQRPTGFKPHLPKWFHGELTDMISTARNITGRDVIISEYGVKIKDAGSEQDVANFLSCADATLQQMNVRYSCWFAYTDAVGAPSERGPSAFGLLSEDNRKRLAWHKYVELHGDTMPTPDDLDPWIGKVGVGLLDMMRLDNTTPAQRTSTWLPLGVTPSDIEECYGKNGTRYYWLLNENKGFRASPD